MEISKGARGRAKKDNFWGKVVLYNVSDGTITLDNGEESRVYNENDVLVFNAIITIDNKTYYNHDVIEVNGTKYLLYQVEKNSFSISPLFENQETSITRPLNYQEFYERLHALLSSNDVVYKGFYYEFLDKEQKKKDYFNFNVKVYLGEDGCYYYGCNRKEEKEIDLIKVVFVGHHLLEEEYLRNTFTYDEFWDALNYHGTFKEVSVRELKEYAYAKMNEAIKIENGCCDEFCECDDIDCEYQVENEENGKDNEDKEKNVYIDKKIYAVSDDMKCSKCKNEFGECDCGLY